MRTKKRFGLVALSALCAGCCAVGVGSLEVEAKASEDQIFAMQSGAYVLVGDKYCGIRWITDISSAYYTTNFDETTKFYTLITKADVEVPTEFYDTIKDEASGELKSPEALRDMGYSVMEAATTETETGYQFTAAITYATPEDDAMRQKGAETELSAYAFAVTGDKISYATGYVDTARSMEGVATVALLSGKYSDNTDTLKQYLYGKGICETADTETTLLEDTNSYYQEDVESNKGKINVENVESGTYSAYADAKLLISNFEVTDTISLDIEKFFNNLTAENLGDYKNVTLVGDNGKLYSQPVQYVSRAIANQAELYDTLKITELKKDSSDNRVYYTEHAGYYILVNDITSNSTLYDVFADCKDYTDPNNVYDRDLFVVGYSGTTRQVITSPSGDLASNSTKYSYWNNNGLTGTFDGKGYTISGLTIVNNGIFGIIDGGTVKDVNIENITLNADRYKPRAALAFSMYNVTLENVRVSVDTLPGSGYTPLENLGNKDSTNTAYYDSTGFDRNIISKISVAYDRALVAVTCGGKLSMDNCIFECATIENGSSATGNYPRNYGSLFAYLSDGDAKTAFYIDESVTNTYVISKYALVHQTSTSTDMVYDTAYNAENTPSYRPDGTKYNINTDKLTGIVRYASLDEASADCKALREQFVGTTNN